MTTRTPLVKTVAAVVGAAALTVLPGCAKPRPGADQVLTRMARAYREAKTLRQHARITVRINHAGETAGTPMTADLHWSFARPAKIRYETTGYRAVVVASDGETVHTALPDALECIVSHAPDHLSELPSVHRYARSAVIGISDLRLLEGEDPAHLLTKVKLEPKDGRVGRVRCYLLSGVLPPKALKSVGAADGTQRIWVGRDDCFIHRSVTRLHLVQNRAVVAGPDTRQSEVIESYERLLLEVVQVEPNVTLPADTFSYTPPPGCRLVTDLRGKPLPDVALPDLQGRPVALKSMRGRNLILLFWASWNAGSLAQLEVLQQFRDSHPDADLAVVAVMLDVQKAAAERSLRDKKVTLPTLMAGGDLERRIAMLDVVSLPKIFLVDQEGIIRDVISQPIGPNDLADAMRAAGFEFQPA